MNRRVTVRAERWPIAGTFTIARGAKTHAEVVVVEITDDGHVGRGECVPYARYGESAGGVMMAVEALRGAIAAGVDRRELAEHASGAARSAIDLALWDLESRRSGKTVAELAGLEQPTRIESAITISIDTPAAMSAAAHALADRPVLKIKLAGDGRDLERVRGVREAAPGARLWVDANEGWEIATYDDLVPRFAELGVGLLEQPLAASADAHLRGRARPIPVCADESFHLPSEIASLADRYDAVNVKLDKAGGLTGAIEAIDAAQSAGMKVVIGCMVSTSLAIAPACLLASRADWVDLDGSILLARDREGGARIVGGAVVPPSLGLWGGGDLPRPSAR